MVASGSDATIAISDVVIMSDNLEKLSEAKHIARNVNKRAIVNVVFILLSKVIVALFAFLSTIYDWIFPLWIAVLSDVGVSVVAIFNSLSILNLYPREKKEKKNGNKKRNQVLRS